VSSTTSIVPASAGGTSSGARSSGAQSSGTRSAGSASSRASSSKKKLVLLAVPLLLLLIVAGLWFGGILPPLLDATTKLAERAALPAEKSAQKSGALKMGAEAKAIPPVFMELPDLVANLNVGQRRSSFIKLKARIEIGRAEDMPMIQASLPRLLDLFSTYLREMRPEELRGSAGTYRLREELIGRANIAVAPARVVDVLFTELLIQ